MRLLRSRIGLSSALEVSRRHKGWLPAACLLSLVVGCSKDSPTDLTPGGSGGSGETDGGSGGTGGSGGSPETGGTGGTPETGGNIGIGLGGLGLGGLGLGGARGDYELPEVAWPSDACVSQVSALLGQMSLEQKAAQMVMGQFQDVTAADVSDEVTGTVFASGSEISGSGSAQDWAILIDGYVSASQTTPNDVPILFGIDAVHGNSKATGTVIFPHNIGLGATRNPELLERIGQVTAFEMAATGASWTFGPVFSVGHDDRWGRTYESYSEDPSDVALLGAAQVVGLQGREGLGTGVPGVIACAKHFAGDGQATYGTSRKAPSAADSGGLVDRADVRIDDAEMLTYGINPYIPAIRAGLGSVMVADTTWNGVNMTGHQRLLTTILKEEIGFAGFVTTDWDAAMPDQEGPGIVAAINAGVDMLMAATNWPSQRSAIIAAAGSEISQERIDDAVRRVLTVKCEAGLFGWTRDPSLLEDVGSEEHRAVGRQAVRESLVLLKHEGDVLPLDKDSNVWVTGSGADALDRQTGGWTISWQNGGHLTEGTTILEGIAEMANVVPTMDEADVVIVVLSEAPYAEWRGDVESTDTLPADDFALLSEAREAGKPVVAVIVSGRPVLITDHLDDADAWIAAWLPGTEGDGIAEVLFGDHNFLGKLSHSWPETADQVNLNKHDPDFSPLFPYGHGLTY